jgi:hypothetical protein
VPKHRLLGGWYVNVYADKGPNNIVVVCKSHYVDCLIKELYTGNSFVNPTYTPTTLTKEEILDNHRSVLCSFGISTKNWIYHHSTGFLNYTSVLTNSYIAGSAKCSTKPLSKLLTCILSAVTTGLQNYCDTRYTRGGMNQMWILKNSKYMLEYIQSRSLSSWNIIKTFDFSTIYTTISHSNLMDKLRGLVQLCVMKRNGLRRY